MPRLKFFSPFLANAATGTNSKLSTSTMEVIVRVLIVFLFDGLRREVECQAALIMLLLTDKSKSRGTLNYTQISNFGSVINSGFESKRVYAIQALALTSSTNVTRL